MGAFDDIKLEWGGKKYAVPAHMVMGAIARVEDVLTLAELHTFSKRGAAPLAKLAQAYGTLLRYAGADVTDEDIYGGFFAGDDAQKVAVEAVTVLTLLMLPPSARMQGGEAPTVNPTRGNRRAAASS